MNIRFSKLVFVFAIAISTASFAQKKEIKTTESTINWTGKKITGSHTGTLVFESGFLTLEADVLKAGEFVVDMTSLAVTDLAAGQGKEKLEGHLTSDDFFGTANYKSATLVITEATKAKAGVYTVKGDLTIKGKTNPIQFDLAVDAKAGTAATTLKVDRTKYDIKYGSGSFFDNLGDKAIDDAFELAVELKM